MFEALLVFWPSPLSAIWGAVCGSVLFWLAGGLASRLAQRGWRVGDTRKIFHVTIFTAAAVLRWQVDPAAVAVYGAVIAVCILRVAYLGRQSALFQALARPSDAPYEKLFVIFPMVSTAIGGVLAQFLAGPLASVAYLVAGWGDAVGEPVGIRWGKHRYRVPGWREVPAERSWEGSAAVLVASTLAAALGLLISGQTGLNVITGALALGIAAAAIEAISPAGWDNLTLLVVIAWLTRVLVG